MTRKGKASKRQWKKIFVKVVYGHYLRHLSPFGNMTKREEIYYLTQMGCLDRSGGDWNA